MVLNVSFQSILLMNIHAHLFSNEIIGYNAGHLIRLDGDRSSIFLHDVIPCQPLEGTGVDRSKTVEMNPESA